MSVFEMTNAHMLFVAKQQIEVNISQDIVGNLSLSI